MRANLLLLLLLDPKGGVRGADEVTRLALLVETAAAITTTQRKERRSDKDTMVKDVVQR
jgi:hypothetical protein